MHRNLIHLRSIEDGVASRLILTVLDGLKEGSAVVLVMNREPKSPEEVIGGQTRTDVTWEVRPSATGEWELSATKKMSEAGGCCGICGGHGAHRNR